MGLFQLVYQIIDECYLLSESDQVKNYIHYFFAHLYSYKQ